MTITTKDAGHFFECRFDIRYMFHSSVTINQIECLARKGHGLNTVLNILHSWMLIVFSDVVDNVQSHNGPGTKLNEK